MIIPFPKFRRQFAQTSYKSLRYPLAKASFDKDWLGHDADRGDPYPLVCGSPDVRESIVAIRDGVCSGYRAEYLGTGSESPVRTSRFFSPFFPHATFELRLDGLNGAAGLSFRSRPEPGTDFSTDTVPSADVLLSAGNAASPALLLRVRAGDSVVRTEQVPVGPFSNGDALVVTSRTGFLDAWLRHGAALRKLATFVVPELRPLVFERNFRAAEVDFVSETGAGGFFETSCAEAYYDDGVSQADTRPVRTEDGRPYMENGRVFLTFTSRGEESGYQGVLSWNPSACDLRMEGVIFMDPGDGSWSPDIASSVLFDRRTSTWYLWCCSFSHGHVLGRGVSLADLRHGVNCVDIRLMDTERLVRAEPSHAETGLGARPGAFDKAVLSDDRLFLGKYGDEDPDLLWDEASGKWLLAICRVRNLPDGKHPYRYVVFESDSPLDGFSFRSMAEDGNCTGGGFVRRADGSLAFVCGSDFVRRSVYYQYDPEDLSKPPVPLEFDLPDGGFRGWGNVFAVPCGSRWVYKLLTFDRNRGSSANWSYGTLYAFTAS